MMRYYIDNVLLQPHTVQGWKDDNYTIVRHTMKGIYREVSQELTYIKQGARLLRTAFYNKGVEANVTLKIERFDKTVMVWSQIFEGKFDFGTFKDADNGVTCTAIDGTISGVLKSKKDTKFAINFDNAEDLFFNSCKDWTNKGVLSAATLPIAYTPAWYSGINMNHGQYKLEFYSKTGLVDIQDTFNIQSVSQSNYTIAGTGFYKNISGVEQVLDIALYIPTHTARVAIQVPSWNPAKPTGFTFKVGVYKQSSPIVFEVVKEISSDLVDNTTEGFKTVIVPDINEKIRMETKPGDELFLIFGVVFDHPAYNNNTDIRVRTEPSCTVTLYVADLIATFGVPAYTAKQMFEEVVSKIGNYTVVSDYLDTLCAKTSDSIPFFTSGEAIRGLDSPKIKLSLSDVFNAVNGRFPIGLGVETVGGVEVVRIEDEAHFYDTSIVYDIGVAKSLTVTPQQIYTTIKKGYKDEENDVPLGRESFNAEQTWRMPIDNVQESEQEAISPAVTDHVSIIQARVKGMPVIEEYQDFTQDLRFSPELDQDRLKDNFVYMIDGEWDAVRSRYRLSRSKFSLVQGVEFPDNVFNVFYSPRRAMLAHGARIRSDLFGIESESIEQTSFTKNVNFTSQLTTESGSMTESDDIVGTSLLLPRFQPFMLSVTIVQPKTFFQALAQAKENGLIRFTYDGNYYYGFVEDVSVKSFDRGEVNFNLVASSANVITNLIR